MLTLYLMLLFSFPAKGDESYKHLVHRPISVFGSDRINGAEIEKFLGKTLDDWIKNSLERSLESKKIESSISERVKHRYQLAYSQLSLVVYPDLEPSVYITLDVVEKKDEKRRLPFLVLATKKHSDPGGLIEKWSDYESRALKLVENGELIPDSESCNAFHCLYGHHHSQLKSDEKVFKDGAKKFGTELKLILKHDSRAEFRRAAAFLLAYLMDGNEVVREMIGALNDPDAIVRNNALRVLMDIADFHKGTLIPVLPIARVLDFPNVTDRSKALDIILSLTETSQSYKENIHRNFRTKIMALKNFSQPNHREPAEQILRAISGLK